MRPDQEDATRTRAANSNPSLTASGERRLRFYPGARLGPYVIERSLGEGGMGAVFVVRHTGTGGEQALKVMAVEEDVNTGAVERFRREGQAQAAAGAHPNVLRVHACGEEDGYAYLAMELARGGDLKARLKAGPLEPRFAAELMRDLARGLAHVHAQGVLHRDIKPGNVVFDEHATPKLMDFGLARLAGAEKLTKTGTMLGTPAYMAPEQAGGETLDERADVYALGAVLFHCLTGRPPFEADAMYVLVRKVLMVLPPSPRSLNPEVPPALDALVLRTLAKAQDQRPQTAKALADELDRFLRGELEAPPRRPVALFLGLAGAALALLVGCLAVAFASRGTDAQADASPPTTDGRAPAPAPARPKDDTIVSPPLHHDDDPSLEEWSIVDAPVERLEVVAAARTENLELRVEHVDARRAVGPQERRLVRKEPLAVGEQTTTVDLAVGWNTITLVRLPEGRIVSRREVVRLAPGGVLERTGRTSVRAKIDKSELRLVPPGWIEAREIPPNDTRPPRAELTAPYLLGVHEVSWGQVRAYRLAVPGPLPEKRASDVVNLGTDGDDQPVNYATMFDAYGYCDWAGLRLPEDLEWERACAGQTAWNGPGEPFVKTCPVTDRTIAGARGTWGHWHLLGNVAEWVQAVYYRDAGDDVRRSGIFGGAFYGDTFRPPKYGQYDPRDQMADTGFRVAHSVSTDRGYFFKWTE